MVLLPLNSHSGFFVASKLVTDSTKIQSLVYSGRATPLLYGDSAPANLPLINACSLNIKEPLVHKSRAYSNT